MVQSIDSADGLICDTCGEGFCEIIESKYDADMNDMIQVVQGDKEKGEGAHQPSQPTLNNQGSLIDQLMSKSNNQIRESDGSGDHTNSPNVIKDTMVVDEDEMNRPPKVTTNIREDIGNTNIRSD